MCLNVGVSFLAAIWQTSTVAARHPVRLHVGAGDGKVTGALGQRVQRGLWLESRWGSRGSLGVTHHRWWCLETFPYKSMAWLNHYYYRTSLWTQYKLEEMQPLNVTKCQIGRTLAPVLSHKSELNFGWIMNHMSRLLPKADSKGNSCTTHQNHKQRSSSCSASGDNSSISGYANTYVINVRSAACSTCVSVFLASHYVSTAEQKARVGPSDRERERDGKEDNAPLCFDSSAPAVQWHSHVSWLWRMCFAFHYSN